MSAPNQLCTPVHCTSTYITSSEISIRPSHATRTLCFNRKSLRERHIFEKHSGFGFECSMCGKIFNRPDNHDNSLVRSELVSKQRSTRTFTRSKSLRNIAILWGIFITKEEQTIMTPKEQQRIKQLNRQRSHSRNWSAGQPQKENRGEELAHGTIRS